MSTFNIMKSSGISGGRDRRWRATTDLAAQVHPAVPLQTMTFDGDRHRRHRLRLQPV